jgi:DNA-binding FadR family transcriptional regulator
MQVGVDAFGMEVFGRLEQRSHRVIDGVLSMVASGALRPDRPLPAERELARRFRVGRRAVRQAVRRLIDGGIVAVDRGGRLIVAATGADPSLAALVRTRRLVAG